MFFDFFFISIAAVCLALALFFTSQRVSSFLTIFSLTSLLSCLTLASAFLYRVSKQLPYAPSGLEFTLGDFAPMLVSDVTTLQVSFFLAAVITSLIYLALILTRTQRLQSAALFYFIFIVSAATLMLVTSAVIFIFLCFELLLLASLGLLKLTSKSERVLEAMEEMFLWTLVGSVCLFVGFIFLWAQGIFYLFDLRSANIDLFVSILLILGFGVKIPVWPCFSWLLKAHVEASVEFSILLSGLIVKLGIFGLAQFLPFFSPEALLCLIALATIALFEVCVRFWGQRDLKRVVALTTVLEMNWLVICLALGGKLFISVAAFLAVAHSFSTTAEFFGVECISRRYGTRDWTQIQGLMDRAPVLGFVLLLTLLVTIGFPGSSIFIAKFFFFIGLANLSFLALLVYGFLFLVVLPLFFFRLWVLILFGHAQLSSNLIFDLTLREMAILVFALSGSFVLGWYPELVLA